MNTYWASNRVRITIPVMDETVTPPVAADPTTMTLKFSGPDGTISGTYTWPSGGGQIVHDGTGSLHCDLDTTGSATGPWTVEVVTTGVQASAVDQFMVNALPL